MTAESWVLAAARVGMALAGFTSIVAVLRPRKEWELPDVASFLLSLEHSLVAVFFGLLPPCLHLWFDAAEAWQVASGLLAVSMLALILLQVKRLITYGELGTVPRWPTMFLLVYVLPSIVSLIAQIVNVAISGGPLVYLLGVLWLLSAAGIQFLLTIHLAAQALEAEIRQRKPKQARNQPKAEPDER